MNIGNAIKLLRVKREFTQKDFAEECGITQTYLSQIETNRKEPRMSKLISFSTVLEVPLPVIFFLAITEDDLSTDKKQAYDVLEPSIKLFVNEFITV